MIKAWHEALTRDREIFCCPSCSHSVLISIPSCHVLYTKFTAALVQMCSKPVKIKLG